MDHGIQEWARNWRRDQCESIINQIRQNITISNNENDDTNQINNNRTYNSKPDSNSIDYLIATAHHLDDQIETMMMKILRGAHITNLYPVSI